MKSRSFLWPVMLAGAWMAVVSVPSLIAVDQPSLLPGVQVLATDPVAAEEGMDPATFTLIRSGPTNSPLAVHYILSGTTENGVDYETLSGTVTIPAGAFSAPVSVRPIDDFVFEGPETVVLTLIQPDPLPSSGLPYRVVWPGEAAAVIVGNDRPLTNAPPTVVLVQPPQGAVFEQGDVLHLTARAVDGDGRVARVEFFDGPISLGVAASSPHPLPPVTGDPVSPQFTVETAAFPDWGNPVPAPAHLLFHLVWSNAPAGPHELTAVATDDVDASHRSAPVTIQVLDTPRRQVVEVKAVDSLAVEPATNGVAFNTGKFRIVRHGPTDIPLAVYFHLAGTASNGVDYAELPTQVTIPAGENSVELVVIPLPDELGEGLEHVRLTIFPPVCAAIYPPPPDCYEVGRGGSASVLIRDAGTPVPPLVRIVRPQDDDVFLAGTDIRIAALAEAVHGSVARVEFFEGANSLGVVTNDITTLDVNAPKFQLVWTNVPPGRYVLTAEATDEHDATARSAPVEIKVVPRIEPPVVRIEAVDPEAAEVTGEQPANPARFRVTRTGSTDAVLTVFYTVHGTARNGIDYEPLSGHVIIPAGATEADVMVSVLDDQEVEGTETVVISLVSPIVLANTASPVAAADLYRIGLDGVARAIIRDDETPPANLPPKVALRSPLEGSVLIAPTDIHLIAGASDPDGSVQSVEFFDGENSLGVVNAPPILDPPNVAGFGPFPIEQRFGLIWSNAPAGPHELRVRVTDNVGATAWSDFVHIRVVEPLVLPVVTIEAIDPDASEGPMTAANSVAPASLSLPFLYTTNVAVFAVRRSGSVETALTVHYALSGTSQNGVDYLTLNGVVTIPPGAREAAIVVQPLDDSTVEGTETVVATLTPVVTAASIASPVAGGYVVGEPHQATAFLRDNDFNAAPKVEIVHPRPDALFAAPAYIQVEVAALDPDGWVPRVDFFADNQLIGTRTLQFLLPPAPGQPLRFSLVWSNAPVGTHVLSALATDDRGGKTRADGVRVFVVDQPELPRVGIFTVDGTAAEHPTAGGSPDLARFRVFRLGATDQPLTVRCQFGGAAVNGVDYATLPSEVTISPGAASVDLVVTPLDDSLPEGTESVIVTLVAPEAAAGGYVPSAQDRAVAFILDNDASANVPPTVVLLNPADGSVFQASSNLLLVAAAADPDGWVQTVEFFVGTNRLGVVTNQPWMLESEPAHVPGLNTNALLPDRTLDHPFSLMWSNVPVGVHTVTAVATDDAGANTRSHAAQVTVRGANEVPLVSIAALDPYTREGTNLCALFEVRRTGSIHEPLTVFFECGGSATEYVDYLAGTRVDFAPGFGSTNILITPLADNEVEGIETVVVRLVKSPTAPDSYQIHPPSVASMFILDSNSPPPASARLRDGSVLLQMAAPKGLPYRLEASDDLIHWEPVFNHVVGDNGIQFVDDKADVRPRRFLRVVPDYTQTGTQ